MCLPVAAVGIASLVASGVGAGVSAYGQYQSAKGQKYALQAQADTARANAQIAAINGTTAQALGNLNANNVLEISELNASLAERIGDLNASMTLEMADLGDKIADGNYQLMLGTAEANARIGEENAQQSLIAGQAVEKRAMLETAGLKSTQIAQLAANGVALDSDSSLRILTTTDYLGEVDVDTIHTNAVREAMGYRTAARAELDAAKAGALSYKAQALGASLSARGDAFNTRIGSKMSALNARTAASFEALAFRTGGASDALNSQIQAAGFEGQARQASAARSAINPALIAGTSLLSSAGQVANQWYSYKKAGVFG